MKSRTDYNVALLKDRVNLHVKKHGGVRNCAKVFDVDPSYITRLRKGEKMEPSDSILRRLGLVKMVVYVDDGSNEGPYVPPIF